MSRFSITSAVQAVPEPASWILMIGGFALAGAAMRHREKGRLYRLRAAYTKL